MTITHAIDFPTGHDEDDYQRVDFETLKRVAGQPGGIHLTIPERQWCLNELARSERYAAQDISGWDDPTVARAVLDAWKAYNKEQGVQ